MNFRPLLLPFSFLYALGARARNFCFDTGIFKSRSFKVPIILVGNLSVGGTGKTPHVEYILRLLHRTFKTATLSRGYGRKSGGFVLAGKGVTAEMIGDEPMQYYAEFNDVTVAVCEKRAEGISRLLQISSPQVIVMDDGFQHRWVNPGLRLLLTPFERPFTNDYLLPAGDLREPGSGYRRASHIIVTRTPPGATEKTKAEIVKKIRPITGQKIFFSSLVYESPVSFFSNETLSAEQLKSKKAVLFTGIANPHALVSHLNGKCMALHTERFSDHHPYSVNDANRLRDIFNKFAGPQGILVTTAKDYHRLAGTPALEVLRNLPCFIIRVSVAIDRETEFNELILNYAGKY
jgi:tetraacyldisaccharide 4'-kinase